MSNAKMQKADYPEERPDWLMVEEYKNKKSQFGCILCCKTHRKEDCEYKAKRADKPWYQKENTQYSYYGD